MMRFHGGGAGRGLDSAARGIRWIPVVAFLSLLLVGCSKESNKPLPANRPPTTYLSIQGVIRDTLSYKVVAHWWGSDSDGNVAGYCIRWNAPWTPPAGAQRWPADSTWIFTDATSDTLPAYTGPARDSNPFVVATDTLQIRAVDDRGAVDPVGCTQVFTVKNWVPSLRWNPAVPLPDTSLCVVSFSWRPTDVDGRRTLSFRYWLDGADSTRARVIRDSVLVLTPQDFDGRFGPRALSVQAIDDSRTPSLTTLRHAWYVESLPTQHYLLIDNVSALAPAPAVDDQFFRSVMATAAPNDFYVLDLEKRKALRTAEEAYPLLSLFKGAVWYSGLIKVNNPANDAVFAANLSRSQSGIGDYLDHGGRLLIVGHNAVGDTAGLSLSFAQERLGLYTFFRRGTDAGRTSNIELPPRSVLYTNVGGKLDSIMTAYPDSRTTDFMFPGRDATGLFWVPPGFFKPIPSYPETIKVVPDQRRIPAFPGVLRDDGNSRFAVITFPFSRSNGFGNRDSIAVAVIRRVLLDTP